VITHAFCFVLPDGPLPKVKGMDDADKAWWMSLKDINQNKSKFFADHYHIIKRFARKY
jgi:bifunctional NMN adenylyltransferase/nudix hydrolase